ncbi:MAG: amidohydrolase [Vicinamibacterales bacterium]
MVVRSLLVLGTLVSIGACGPAQAPLQTADMPDLVILNGRVLTMDDAGTTAEAVAVRGSTILQVGTTAAITALAGPATRVLDAAGGTVAPGFNDAHLHFLEGALGLGDADLSGLATLAEVQGAIRTFAQAHPAPSWVIGRGWLYAPFPGGSPTAAQLDAVVSDRPALMRCYDGLSVWVNSKALALAGITRDTPNPAGGEIVRDGMTGQPTGHLKQAAIALIDAVVPRPTHDDERRALRAAVARAHELGITSIQNAGGSLEEIALYEEARRAGDLALRTRLAVQGRPTTSDAELDRMDEVWRRLGDDPTLTSGIVKLNADGVIEARTAAMLAPYVGTSSSGPANYTPDQLDRVVAMFDRRGWQVEIHAIGDRAIRMSLDAIERASAANPAPARGRRHRLEHVEAVSAADIPRLPPSASSPFQPMHAALGDVTQARPSGPGPTPSAPSAPRGPGAGRACSGPARGWLSAATGRWHRWRRAGQCGWPRPASAPRAPTTSARPSPRPWPPTPAAPPMRRSTTTARARSLPACSPTWWCFHATS